MPFYRGVGRQRRRGFGALAQVYERTAIPFLRKYIFPAAKSVGADLLEFAAPEIAEFVVGRRYFKKTAKSVGRQTLRKQFGSVFRKRTSSRVSPTKSAEQISRSRRDNFQTFLINHVEYFSVPTFCGSFWTSCRESPSS